ncbi:MAG: hypothetical protein A3J49_10700 [Gallionellales bacterium RIFCSPHIGHO2_02_FULL_57_16]|nr:MAG: hypothetical protein A3J49_10700 [Gallionellales bacterium RIFCSPHIGHO2_02_FULL_57_16]
MWEVKTTDGGLRDWSKTYTNYNPLVNPINQYGTATDATGFITAVNATNLCGRSTGWRLPLSSELQTLVPPYVAGITKIYTTWFPNTQSNYYWSGTPFLNSVTTNEGVDFRNGGIFSSFVGNSFYVRLVHVGQ